MVNKRKPWRTSLKADGNVESGEEIRERILEKVAGKLGKTVPDVDLVFCGTDGDQISRQNTPFLRSATVFASGIEDIAGDNKTLDPLKYSEGYENPALVVYDRNKLHSSMDDGGYEASDDAVLGVLFINNDEN